ncbi:MAG: response regulator transcription factor [Anaerolineae bacterium]
MSDRILIVDDEQRIIDLARMYIEREGYQVESTTNGQQALDKILSDEPALVVLDLMLPGLDGLEVCRRVRAQSDVPIIMLTARSEDIDKIVGLELGADDYLTKPFNPHELIARIKAILRRSLPKTTANPTRTVTVGNLTIIPNQRTVKVGDKPVELRMKEFDLLLVFAENPEIVFERDTLLNVVWGYDFAGETRTVDVHVAHLRHKLKGMSPTIETVWGIGYKLVV